MAFDAGNLSPVARQFGKSITVSTSLFAPIVINMEIPILAQKKLKKLRPVLLEGKDAVVSALKEQIQEETTSEKLISSDQGLFWVDNVTSF